MKKFNIFIPLVLIVLIGACTSIKSVSQLGEDVYILNEDEWEGTWAAGENSLQVKIIDTESSEILIMFIEKGKIQKYTVFIKQNGKDSYMNLVDEDNRYFFTKFIKTKNQVIIWLPSEKALKHAISDKKLEGLVTKDKDIVINANKNSFNQYFIDNKEKMLFEYEKPLILRKLIAQ